MKICMFCGFYPDFKGGAEYQAKIFALNFVKDNDLFYISLGHKRDDVVVVDGIKVYQLKFNLLLNKFLLYYPIAWKIKSILIKEKPTILYQRILNSFSFHLAKICKTLTISYFIHVADNYSLSFTKGLSSIIRKFFFESIIRSNANFITQTQVQSDLLSRYGVRPVLKMPNLHPLPTTSNIETPKLEAPLIICWIGSARRVKQLELFIEIASFFKNDNRIKFVIIGRILNDKYSEDLMNKVNLNENIEYLGEKSNDFINDYLSNVFLLVNTSKSEGFSNTFIQGWMRGVPVLSLNSDPDRLISTNGLGFIGNGDLMFLKIKIDDLLASSDNYQKIRVNCIEFSWKHLSLENNIIKLKEALNISR